MPLYPASHILPGYNDEPLHLQYVKFIGSGGGLPVWEYSSDSLNYLTDAYIHPPAYYFLTVPFYTIAETLQEGWGLYGPRFVSIIFGLIAGFFIYKTALLWFKDERIATGALAAGLLAPNAVFFTSIVTNDSLVYCLSAIAVFYVVLCRLSRGEVSKQIITAVFIAGAVWAKMSGLTLIPLAWFAASPDLPNRDKWLVRVRILLVIIVLISPLLIRNLVVYDQFVPGQRTPLADEYWPEHAVGVSGGAVFHPVSAIATCLRLSAVPFMDIWGSLLEKGISSTWVLFWGCILLLGTYRMIRKKPKDYTLLATVALVVIGFLWHNIGLYQVEFRLFMPAFPAMAVIVASGAAAMRLPSLVQALLWCLPLLLMPFF
ncbi:MAG: hypothetical protein P9X24_13545 [Candidatus Hatepunaea meridiana]|nr:hypothetical protein [Candidatus Hatepunaea meridiana]